MTTSTIEAICAAFEEAHRTGAKPQLRDWVIKVPENQQADLFRKLLEVELSQKQEGSRLKSLEEYLAEFPDFSECTVQAFAEQARGTADWQPTPNSPVKLKIGNFRLLQVLGKGGMGTVWLAEREGPLKQRVAIKLIKDPDKFEEKLKRFDIERQALSLMNHINIARVVDLGSTATGMPYFAMEYVPGLPLNTYCNRNGLSLEERLDIFCQICEGVQHAHQKGIIHRDLKPGNILVTEIDGKPVPKIIDFGLAKAIGGTGFLVQHSLHTSLGQVIGSYLYMSPEQASGETLDIDTRTDIYSLGVILYELLTNRTPIEASSITEKAIHKVLEIIRDTEPQRPSRKLHSSTEAGFSTISEKQGLEPKKLSRALESELDWIVMKSLEKNRTRRYETANSFAEDIQRYLRNEPILARPPSLGYVVSKFIRRHRTAVTVAGLLVGACGIAVTSLLWSWIEIRQANLEKTVALQEAEATSKFWMDVLAEPNANGNYADISLQDTLAIAARKTIKAENISDNSKSKYYGVLHSLISNDSQESLTPEIEKEMRHLLDHSPTLSARNRSVLRCALAAIDAEKDPQLALKAYEEEVPKLATIAGKADAEYVVCQQNLGYLLSAVGDKERGRQMLQKIWEMESDDPDVIPTLLEAKRNYALSFISDYAEQQAALKNVYRSSKAKLGKNHPQTLKTAQTIGSTANDGTATEFLQIALEGYEDVYGLYQAATQFTRLEWLGSHFNSNKIHLTLPQIDHAQEFYRRKKLDLSPERFWATYKNEYKTFQSLYALAYTETGQFAKVEPTLILWCDAELKDMAPKDKLLLYWRLCQTQLMLNKLDEAALRIAELEAIPDKDEISRYETDSLTSQLQAYRTLQQLKTENLEEPQRVETKTAFLAQIQVLENLWAKHENIQPSLMSEIVAHDLAGTLVECYSLLEDPEKIELWRTRCRR